MKKTTLIEQKNTSFQSSYTPNLRPGLIVFILSTLTSTLGSPFALSDTNKPADLYYSGTARIINLLSGVTSDQKLIMIKTLSPKDKLMSEVACYQDPNTPSQLSSVYIKIEDNTGQISDTSDFNPSSKLKGSVALSGTPWNWSYLKFSMNWNNGVVIEDSNFVVKNKLIARKSIFLPDRTPLELWDIEMTSIEFADYKAISDQMHCPTKP